ncbi:MAG: hypothetical protein RI964_1743 [Pseudomonadota bacterium]|jgi:hypothetical protein
MKKLLIVAAFSALVMSVNAMAGTNINGFAYQLQQAGDITVNASEEKDKGGKESVVGSQVIYSETALNVNGRALQEMHMATAKLNAENVRDSVVGLQVAKSDGVINANGSLEQLIFASDVSVKATDADHSIIGAQVIHAKGDLNINGSAKQMMFAQNIAVTPTGSDKSIVGAQIIAGR